MVGRPVSAYAPARHLLAALLAAFFAFVVSATHSIASADEPPVETWLRGAGENLELRLHGEVLDANGAPAKGVEVSGVLKSAITNATVAAQPEGHRFEIWLPVNRQQWHALRLKAIDPATGHVAYHMLSPSQFREAALTGVQLTLAEPSRQLTVTPLFAGKPLPHAVVQLELDHGVDLRAEADDAGVAHFALLPEQKPTRITAWKDHELIGGFSFNRNPAHEPDLDHHDVELSATRQQPIRFVDAQGAPVSNVSFTFHVSTPAPFYDYIGYNEEFQLTTNDDGVAICRLFPDWKESKFYPEIWGKQWYAGTDHELVDGAIVYKLLPRIVREPVRGKVVSTETGVAGFYVEMTTFQEERPEYLEQPSVFADAAGNYEVRVQPDATYVGQVVDAQWAGKPVDVVPFQTTPRVAAGPELSVVAGQPVEVTLTSGADNRPIANQFVHFSAPYQFSWRENGKERSAQGGARWWAVTDREGKITAHSYPGKLEVSVYTPLWRDSKTATVAAGETTAFHFHRQLLEKRKITGTIVASDGRALGEDVAIHAEAIDGETPDQQLVRCDANGSFQFEIHGKYIGLFAKTADGALAGGVVIDESTAPVTLTLQPTARFAGQIIGKLDRPLAGCKVEGYARLTGQQGSNRTVSSSMNAVVLETTTDADGRYAFTDVPAEMEFSIYVDEVAGQLGGTHVDDVRLAPGEVQPPVVTKLARSQNDYEGALADSYRTKLRDSRLGGYGLLVIDADQSDRAKELVDHWFFDRDSHPDLPRFMQITLPRGSEKLTDDDRAFITAQKWSPPAANQVILYALDGNGRELGRLAVDAQADDSADAVAKFITAHAPARHDAAAAWQAALAEAKRTNRRVWAISGGRYCSPCFRLARWLDDHRQLLEKDFVFFKVDGANDLNAAPVVQLITGGKEKGIPFNAVFDPAGKQIIGSAGPVSYLGYPTNDEDKRHLRKMFAETKQRLTDAEIEEIIQRLPQ